MRSIHAAAWLLCTVGGAASGQQVIWKCQDAKGAQTFQNAPCSPGTREVRARIYETPSDSREAAIRAWRIRREMDQRNAALRQPVHESPSYSAPSARQLKQAECAAAHRRLFRPLIDPLDATASLTPVQGSWCADTR